MTNVRTTCPYCGVGCGVLAKRTGTRTIEVTGDPDHPANCGKLCSKGTHLGETVALEGRLLHPEINGARAHWDAALDAVANGFRDAIETYGPESVAIYGSGQLLTEDYYAANKLMKGYIGTANIDTNSRLCMASAVAAHIRAFGEDIVPCSYSDIDEADLIVLVGSNTAWCHPILWQRIEAARAERGTKLVVIDPRRTETAAGADLHLAIRADGDTALWNAALSEMRARGLVDAAYLDGHVDVPEGFWDGLDGDTVALTDLPVTALEHFFGLLAAHPRTLTMFSMGVNQSVGGTDKANAIINFHLATGRIGKAGAGPFSITGQPNAMGGREVGGLATTLAAHLPWTDEGKATAQAFWNSPRIAQRPGLKAVDLFRAVDRGQIKVLWIMATNPAVSMPNASFVRTAIAKCPLVIVTDMYGDTDTAKLAHIKLPALGWAEKDGTVTNSERVISRQRAMFEAPGEARADWAIIADVARRMGFDGFDWSANADVFAEFAAMTRFQNDNVRALSVPLVADYETMAPFQWGGRSPFASAQYRHPNRRARLIAVTPVAPVTAITLNTGRYRDQWHTMTRTGLSARLSQHRREPLIEVHPDDAAEYDIVDNGFATVGQQVFRACVTDAQRRGEVFVPMHWSDQLASGGRTNREVSDATCAASGQPGFKRSVSKLTAWQPDWRGFLVTGEGLPRLESAYWVASRVDSGWVVEMAGIGAIDADALLPAGERVQAFDSARGTRRIAVRSEAGTLVAALFLTRSGKLPPRDWIAAQLGEDATAQELLAGRAANTAPDAGPIVCVCFNVGAKTIGNAITQQGCSSVEAVGAAVRAGTNCGSCRPAIAGLLRDITALQAA